MHLQNCQISLYKYLYIILLGILHIVPGFGYKEISLVLVLSLVLDDHLPPKLNQGVLITNLAHLNLFAIVGLLG